MEIEFRRPRVFWVTVSAKPISRNFGARSDFSERGKSMLLGLVAFVGVAIVWGLPAAIGVAAVILLALVMLRGFARMFL